MASCPPISCTMSDGEGPSAGEWQRYIYPPWLWLQSQGLWSSRAQGPHRLQAAVGLVPLPTGLMFGGGGLGSWRVGRVTFKAHLHLPPSPPPSFPMGLDPEAELVTNPSWLSAGRPELTRSAAGAWAAAGPPGGGGWGGSGCQPPELLGEECA